ncbi:hypothetical protein SAMN04487895_11129 [Paenibacillus sophorae]|uniref:Uncharacterized protein n=1 Tax=Paenibacillus sophorae TaxID=1333845 RepID=A0A1H8S7W7_9BACL|nr:hypothetical protein [Paenibacillus sophorae]QWU16849.1 hypothetical protein KP014_06485 [Paenibacillus sophorae]SEO74616.1 hypothetical protein SAMN04487895_11129 [Paenibacillus sophorae]
MSGKEDLERRLSEMLTEGELAQSGREAGQRHSVSPKYEIRIQTALDPIVEETYRYREMARELDDRYDKYLERTRTKERKDASPDPISSTASDTPADRKELSDDGG